MRPASALPTAILVFLCAAVIAGGEARGYVVVVNGANPQSSISAADLARVFKKTTRRWESGSSVEPVDQALDSAVRSRFSREILGKTPLQTQEYWLRETYSGREVPPPIRSSDAAVLEYVRGNAGAIGYVSVAASLPSGVKPLTVAP